MSAEVEAPPTLTIEDVHSFVTDLLRTPGGLDACRLLAALLESKGDTRWVHGKPEREQEMFARIDAALAGEL